MFFRKYWISLALLSIASVALAQGGSRGTATVTIGGKQISIDYGRPSLGGRDMLAQATVGTVWRVGMNQPTVIETAANLSVGGKEVKAGKYSLWMKKTSEANWTLAFHPTVPNWGKPELTEGYVAETSMKLGKAPNSVDLLTISLAAQGNKALMTVHWGGSEFTGSFDVK